MISFERSEAGVSVSVWGRRLLAHEPRKPGIFSGSPTKRASLDAYRWTKLPLPACAEGDESACRLDFPSFASISIEAADRLVSMRFAGDATLKSGIRLRLGPLEGERFLAEGPRLEVPWLGEGKASEYPERPMSAVIFTCRGEWAAVADHCASDWRFGKSVMDLRCARVPAEIALGLAETPGEGMKSLTGFRYRGKRPELLLQESLEGPPPKEQILIPLPSRPASKPKGRATGAAEFVKQLLAPSFEGGCLPAFTGSGADARLAILAGLGPVFPDGTLWKTQSEGTRLLTFVTMLFEELYPYRAHLAEQWPEEGIPLVAHPALRYPGAGDLCKREDTYMVGEDLFIAPSLGGMPRLRSLLLPRDEWIHLWTSRKYSGGAVAVDAPDDRPAVFYRASSPFASLFDSVRRKATRL